MLAKERPVAVQAGMYADSGGGCQSEITLRLIERGVDALRCGLVLRPLKVVAKSCKGMRRKSAMRARLSDLSKAVEKQYERARDAIATRSRPN